MQMCFFIWMTEKHVKVRWNEVKEIDMVINVERIKNTV
jgi:hypothetical protein